MKKFLFGFLICLLFLFLFGCEEETPLPEVTLCEHVRPTGAEGYTVTKEPTEEETGERRYNCILCGESFTEKIPLLSEENFSILSSKPANCTSEGVTVYFSENWGEYTVVTEAKGHLFADVPHSSTATCEQDGFDIYLCARCNAEKKVEKEASGHNFVLTEDFAGNCYEKAFKRYRCTLCGEEPEAVETDFRHDYAFAEKIAGDCLTGEYGYELYRCTECEKEIKKNYDTVLTHEYACETGTCTKCGAVCSHSFSAFVCTVCRFSVENAINRDGYYLYDRNGNGEADIGEKVYFGSYPQSHVTDTEILEALDFRYREEQTTYLYDNVYYEACSVKNQLYRSVCTFSDGTSLSEAVSGREIHYFRYDPICWTVTENDEGELTLLTDDILLTYTYQSDYQTRGNAYYVREESVYANDWEHSELRRYLSSAFLETAFSATQRERLQETVLCNQEGYYDNQYQTAQNDTTDLVYIPAFSDLYQKDDDVEEADENKVKTASDYLICLGASVRYDQNNELSYFLRSAGNGSGNVCAVTDEGFLDYTAFCGTAKGVCVAINLLLPAQKEK